MLDQQRFEVETMAPVVPFDNRSDVSAGEELGHRIAELNAYLNIAQAHLLGLSREFDKQRCWEALGAAPRERWPVRSLPVLPVAPLPVREARRRSSPA